MMQSAGIVVNDVTVTWRNGHTALRALSLMMLLSPGVTGTQHCAMHPSQYQVDLLPLWLG